MKKLLITIMVGLTTIAAVSCGTKTRRDETTGLDKTKGINAIQIADNYDFKVTVQTHKENGKIINYYASYERPIKCTNWDGEETYVKLTYVDQYDANKNYVKSNIGYSYYEAMSYFNPVKP